MDDETALRIAASLEGIAHELHVANLIAVLCAPAKGPDRLLDSEQRRAAFRLLSRQFGEVFDGDEL